MKSPGEALIIKMWETIVDKGIGTLLTPWHERRIGRTRVEVRCEEIVMLAQAERDAQEVRSGRMSLRGTKTPTLLECADTAVKPPRVVERIEPTLTAENILEISVNRHADELVRTEINATKALLHAESVLANDDAPVPPDAEVETDWIYAWREYAGKVSSDELQRLWGELLAGEIKEPGKYPLRTLEFLKCLSKAEADDISKVASFALEGLIAKEEMDYLEEKGVPLDVLLRLRAIGVLASVESRGLSATFASATESTFIRALRSHGKALLIRASDAKKVCSIIGYPITGVGQHILTLGRFSPDVEYLKRVGSRIAKQDFKVTLTDWVDLPDGRGRSSAETPVD